jgi:hypothetical protein
MEESNFLSTIFPSGTKNWYLDTSETNGEPETERTGRVPEEPDYYLRPRPPWVAHRSLTLLASNYKPGMIQSNKYHSDRSLTDCSFTPFGRLLLPQPLNFKLSVFVALFEVLICIAPAGCCSQPCGGAL